MAGTVNATEMNIGGLPVGYRGIPGRDTTITTALTSADSGKAVIKLGTGAINVNITPQGVGNWQEGDTILVVNFSSSGNIAL